MKTKHWITLEWFLLTALTAFIPFDLINGNFIGIVVDVFLGVWTIHVLERLYSGEEY